MKQFTFEAKSEKGFDFKFSIQKAVPTEENGMLYVEGIASTLNVDHDNERMSEDALKSMVNIVNTKSVPLRIEHQSGDDAIVGSVNKAWIDERQQMWIRAELPANNTISKMLHESLKKGVKLGLSVGGRIKRAMRELSESVGKQVRTFYDVELDEVSVTQRPANYDAWLFAKGYAVTGDDLEPLYKSEGLQNEFLFENPHLDYLAVFRKSIPNQEWVKVGESDEVKNEGKTPKIKVVGEPTNKNMKKAEEEKKEEVEKEEEKKDEETTKEAEGEKKPEEEETKKEAEGEKKEEKDEETTKMVSTKTFKSFADQVTKGLSSLSSLLAKMAEEKDEKKDEETEKEAEGDKKPEEDKEMGKEAEGEKKEETKKESKEDAEDQADEYDLAGVEEAIKSIEDISKRLEGKKEVLKSIRTGDASAIDEFVSYLQKALGVFTDTMKKSNKRVVGIERAFADFIRTDEQMQKSIKEMIAQPGFKKSVSLGVPYMITKGGQRFALTASPVVDKEEIQKSAKDKSFKEIYKTEFSTTKEE